MKDTLTLPGRKRGTDADSAIAVQILHEMYLEYHHTKRNSSFKMLRLDRYFWELEVFMTSYMQRTKGGEEFDNRRRT